MREMSKRLSSIIIIILALVLASSNIVASSCNVESPSAILLDSTTGDILYEKNIDSQRAIASTTKIMTYLLVMEAIEQGKISMNDKVTISSLAAKTGGSSYTLKAGDRVSVRELIDSMIIISANDSAAALAEHVSGSVYKFSLAMNEKASQIGLEQCNFVNPHGLPSSNKDQNKMTTKSLAKLTDYTFKKYGNDLINTSKKKFFTGTYKKYSKKNTNKLLESSALVDGLKTGYTDLAGYCLVSTYTHPQNKGHRLISIVLGSRSSTQRFEDSSRLIRHGADHYNNSKLINKGQLLAYDFIRASENKVPVELIAVKDIDKLIYKNQKIKLKDISLREEISEADIGKRNIAANALFSDGSKREIEVKLRRGVSVFLNNEQLDFGILHPVVRQERTLVPIRVLSEQMGFKVDWNNSDKSVKLTKEGNTMAFKIGSKTIKKDGQEIKIDDPSEIINNTTFVPVRFISESLNKEVSWVGDLRQVFINDKEIEDVKEDDLTHIPENPVE